MVDIQQPKGADLVRQMAAGSDVLIQNFRPGVMDALGLGYEDIRALNPGIVYARGTGYGPLGAAAILTQDPVSRPQRLKKSPAPLFHAASKAVRQVFYEGFALFVGAYRTAAEKLQRGDPAPCFPTGCFPPAMPFVGG